ncbi:MAG: sulfate ABC transporter substrate-binding protein [Deltaproteobacteria bacterium]|nr:sulfate ABC transporter substrate-binding protein [Deltaproteobacteria bacterium]
MRSLLLGLALATACSAPPSTTTLLNVSFDPTRELYDDVNAAFAKKWTAEHGTSVTIRQSHGGSGKQTRAVLDGLDADVVTLALSHDVDVLAAQGQLLPLDWAKRLPHESAPFSSTIVFLVRAGNPKGIHDWDDLIRDDVDVIAANPKTSGGARLVTLAAWDHARRRGGDVDAQAFLSRLYRNVPVLDTGARAAATTFAERGIGDVLVSWESDARLLLARPEGRALALVLPSSSVRADLPVAVVDKNVDKHGTRALAEAYVAFLYSPEAQDIAARHHYRPSDPEARARAAFPAIPQRSVADIAGSWAEAQQRFFDDRGLLDQVLDQAFVGR